jgi:hypothetical protein
MYVRNDDDWTTNVSFWFFEKEKKGRSDHKVSPMHNFSTNKLEINKTRNKK